jgi:hypothetical protein
MRRKAFKPRECLRRATSARTRYEKCGTDNMPRTSAGLQLRRDIVALMRNDSGNTGYDDMRTRVFDTRATGQENVF